MKEITLEMIEGAYPIAKKVYSGSLTTTEGKIKIAEETGMAENSAMFYIDIFLKMLAGEVYKVSFNQMGIEYLLENIKKDYGNDSYQKAFVNCKCKLNTLVK